MHERSERALCRLAFVLICALPTSVVTCWTVAIHTPWYHRAQVRELEATLTQLCGLDVRLGDFRRPQPNIWELHDVKLLDNETGEPVATIRYMATAELADERKVVLRQPRVQAGQVTRLLSMLHDRLLCQPRQLSRPTQIEALDLTIAGPLQGVTLTPVRISLRDVAESELAIAVAEFSVAGQTSGQAPPRMTVWRTRGQTPSTVWELDTRGTPLPCSVLADYLPAMRYLGANAMFAGRLHVGPEDRDVSVRLSDARFTGVNMLDLTQGFDEPVAGIAEIRISHLVRRAGEPIREADGALFIGEGARVSTNLVEKLRAHFGARFSHSELEPNQRLHCDMIAFNFQLTRQRLKLWGDCEDHWAEVGLPPQTGLVAGPFLVIMEPHVNSSRNAISDALDRHGELGSLIGQNRDLPSRLLPAFSPPVDRQDRAPRVSDLRIGVPGRE